MLTQPADPAQVRSAPDAADDAPVWRDRRRLVRRGRRRGDDRGRALTPENHWQRRTPSKSAMDDLPDDALARLPRRARADSRRSQRGAGRVQLGSGSARSRPTRWSTRRSRSSPRSQGLRVEGVARSERLPGSRPARRSSPSSSRPTPWLRIVQRSRRGPVAVPRTWASVAAIRPDARPGSSSLLGVSLEDDVLPLFAGESGLYVRAGERRSRR